MTKLILAGAAASAAALFVLPANAADWGKKMDMCAAAIEAEGFVDASEYDVKFVSGSSRRLKIELVPDNGGESLIAECKISRGKVSDVAVQA